MNKMIYTDIYKIMLKHDLKKMDKNGKYLYKYSDHVIYL